MKNIIIVGASRSGKSTVAKKTAKKYNMSYIPFDSIVSTLENSYQEIGIKHLDENEDMSKKLSVFLKEFIEHLKYEEINYVIDLYQIYPKDLSKFINLDTHLVLYFGYPNLTPKEKLVFVKKHAREKDWTRNMSDEDMLSILELFIKENKVMYDECLELKFKFFDTGENFQKSLESAEEFICRNI